MCRLILYMSVAILSILLGGCASTSGILWVKEGALRYVGDLDAAGVRMLIKRFNEDPSINRLIISSEGGKLVAAMDLGEYISDHHIDVVAFEYCYSSCANYVFPAGRRKRLPSSTLLVWHMDAQLHGAQEGSRSNWFKAYDVERTIDREVRFYNKLGVNPAFSHFGMLPPHDTKLGYTVLPSQLARMGIRDVQIKTTDEAYAKMVREDVEGIDIVTPPLDWNGPPTPSW